MLLRKEYLTRGLAVCLAGVMALSLASCTGSSNKNSSSKNNTTQS